MQGYVLGTRGTSAVLCTTHEVDNARVSVVDWVHIEM